MLSCNRVIAPGLLATAVLWLTACTLQAPYQASAPQAAAHWAYTPDGVAGAAPIPANDEAWWSGLHDPAVDVLVAAALADNPSLEMALARLDEARATLGVNRAQRLPTATLNASATRARSENDLGIGNSVGLEDSTAQAGPSLAWEIDLWGRVKQSVTEAQKRLDARDADAQAARLSVASQVASGVLNLRSCNYSLLIREHDIRSREIELKLTRQRVAVGNEALVDEATSLSNLATARTNRLTQQEQCARYADALQALSGQDVATIQGLLAQALPAEAEMPVPPASPSTLPATVLETHPEIVAAQRDVEATWADIGVARANRLPKVEIDAVLTGQWLSAAGSAFKILEWSLGPALNGPLFDGGAGRANVDAAQARYLQAVATLHTKLRATVQNVDDALAQQASAQARLETSQQALDAARIALRANEDRWRVGTISLFDLETSRRQFEAAEESAIATERDRALAWVALVQATGYGPALAANNLAVPHTGMPE